MIYFKESERKTQVGFLKPIDEKSFDLISLLVEMGRSPIIELTKTIHNRGEMFSIKDFSVANAGNIGETISMASFDIPIGGIPDIGVDIRKRNSKKASSTIQNKRFKYEIIVKYGHHAVVAAFRAGLPISAHINGIIDKTQEYMSEIDAYPVVPFSKVYTQINKQLWEESGAIGD